MEEGEGDARSQSGFEVRVGRTTRTAHRRQVGTRGSHAATATSARPATQPPPRGEGVYRGRREATLFHIGSARPPRLSSCVNIPAALYALWLRFRARKKRLLVPFLSLSPPSLTLSRAPSAGSLSPLML